MTTPSYLSMYESYVSRSNFTDKFNAGVRDLAHDIDLSHVTSCIAVGPSTGRHEVEFIRQLVPNLRTLTAVEQDAAPIAGLRNRLATDLPAVSSTIHETSFLTWSGPTERVDLILLFNTLYYVETKEIRKLFVTMRQWLNDDGLIVVLHEEDPPSWYALVDLMQPGSKCDGDHIPKHRDVNEAALDIGLSTVFRNVLEVESDWRDPDELLLQFMQFHLASEPDLDAIRDAMNRVYPDGRYVAHKLLTVFGKSAA